MKWFAVLNLYLYATAYPVMEPVSAHDTFQECVDKGVPAAHAAWEKKALATPERVSRLVLFDCKAGKPIPEPTAAKPEEPATK